MSLQIRLTNEIVVDKLPPEIADKVHKKLTIENPLFKSAAKFGRSTRGMQRWLKLYHIEGTTHYLPRGFLDDFLDLCKAYQVEIKDETISFEKTTLPDLPLWDYQVEAVNAMLQHKQGLLVAPPGAGKTVVALSIYAKLGQPCIWLTHTRGLARQVANRLKSFTGQEAGMIGEGKEDIKHFTIGLIPTLIRRDLSKYSNLFGLVLADECHHLPSRTWAQVVDIFKGSYRYGVTATPYREDGLEAMMFHAMGPIRYTLDKEFLRSKGKLMTPKILRRKTDFWFPYDPYVKNRNYIALEEALPLNEERNNLIISDVFSEAFQEGNTCIVLVERIEHGIVLHEKLSKLLEDVAVVHSKMKAKQADATIDSFSDGKLRVLIATYKMLAEGFDYQPTNRLFLTAPIKARSLIEQGIGRIERVIKGKKDALVYDYMDEKINVLRNQAQMRKEIYELSKNPIVDL